MRETVILADREYLLEEETYYNVRQLTGLFQR